MIKLTDPKLGYVLSVLAGRTVLYTRPGTSSAIGKQPVATPVWVHTEGLTGDEQGDRRAHGGPNKAVHIYPVEHYDLWRDELGGLPMLQAAGAFGENLSTRGLTEVSVCLGDQMRIGSALLEVSEARQPCWKLNDRFGVPDMARRVQTTLRTGWYYRVLEPGWVGNGDVVTLVTRPFADWSLYRLIGLLYHRTTDMDLLKSALELPLVPSWRQLLETRLASGQIEDWTSRIEGPSVE